MLAALPPHAPPMFPHDKLDWTLSRLDKRLDAAPDDVSARLEYATAALSRARFHDGGELWLNQALTQARRVLQADPANGGALVVAGLALVGLDRLEPAARHLDEALKIGPDRPDVHYARGALHRRDGDRHAAVRELEMACRLAPESWEVHALLGRLLGEQADELGAPRRFDLTPAYARRVLERSQYHVVRALQLGPSAPLRPRLLHDLGVLCLRTGRHEDALKVFTRVQEHERYADKARYYLGLVSYHLGKYKNAILHHRRYLEDHPENAHVHARIGMSYLHLGEVEKAREACHRALAIEPTDLQARWTLGCAWLEEGQVDEAIRSFKEILRDAPQHLPAFTELVRIRGDHAWLRQALRAEVGSHDRLPSRERREHPSGRGTVLVDPRASVRERVRVLVSGLAELDEDTVPVLLEAMDLTTDEALRFQLWEAALAQTAHRRARGAVAWLEQPGRHYGARAGREVLALAEFLPEPLLTRGLQLEEEDLKRAAVDRHGPARDVAAHRTNIERERQEARAWQALLLLAVASRGNRSARNLLVRWSTDADPELGQAAQAALVLLGDSPLPLRERARDRGVEALVEALERAAAPARGPLHPRPVSDDEALHCSTCGRRSPEVDHMMAGPDGAVCDRCMMDIVRSRRDIQTEDPAVQCVLCGNTNLDVRGVYVHRGLAVCAECTDQSLGLVEREEVDRFLTNW